MSLSNAKKLIYRKFGSELEFRGQNIQVSTYNFETTVFTYEEVKDIMDKKLGKHFPLRDERHAVVNIEDWQELIKSDWTNKREYITDFRDCDDYAEMFCARMSWVYKLNSAFPISVELLDPNTGKHIGYHRAVIILTKLGGLYMYDPMNDMEDEIVRIDDPDNIVIKNWKYVPRIIRN